MTQNGRRSSSFADYVARSEAEATPERRQQMEAAKKHARVLYAEHFSLGDQLAALRKAHGLTQQQLAHVSGINQPEISRIEQGKANPTQDTLARLGASVGAVLAFTSEDGVPVTA